MLTRRSVPLRAILLPILLSAALLGSGCEESPTGRKQVTLVPDAQMSALGERSFAELLRTLPLNDDPDVRAHVGCVAETLVEALPQPHERWTIAVFGDSTPNAFALPGGKIGVHAGMLQVARTPDQLAAVIAHEIAHVLADHSNERLTRELAVQGGLMLVDLFTEEPSTRCCAGRWASGRSAVCCALQPNPRARGGPHRPRSDGAGRL